MRIVVRTEEGQLEVNWSWLPTFIGLNAGLQKDLTEHLRQYVGVALSPSTLDDIEVCAIQFLEERFKPISGLGAYLDALKYVGYEEDDGT